MIENQNQNQEVQINTPYMIMNIKIKDTNRLMSIWIHKITTKIKVILKITVKQKQYLNILMKLGLRRVPILPNITMKTLTQYILMRGELISLERIMMTQSAICEM